VNDHAEVMVDYYSQRVPYWKDWDVSTAEGKGTIEHVKWLLSGRRVLEIACGTGFWASQISQTAQSVVATDYTEAMLQCAREQTQDCENVVVQKADANSLVQIEETFSAGFHFQWFSHVPLAEVTGFLERFHSKLETGARVVFGDNRVQGEESTPAGDYYTTRELPNGNQFRIIKNYPTEGYLRDVLSTAACGVTYVLFRHNWFITYTKA
tara:strand:- start:494 stop:1123 length:630 start_codon:yes stop_codon:yes gene_type:complete